MVAFGGRSARLALLIEVNHVTRRRAHLSTSSITSLDMTLITAADCDGLKGSMLLAGA